MWHLMVEKVRKEKGREWLGEWSSGWGRVGGGGYGLSVVFQDLAESVGSWGGTEHLPMDGLKFAPGSEEVFPYGMTPSGGRTSPRTVHPRLPHSGSPKPMQCGACFLPERKPPLFRTSCLPLPSGHILREAVAQPQSPCLVSMRSWIQFQALHTNKGKAHPTLGCSSCCLLSALLEF